LMMLRIGKHEEYHTVTKHTHAHPQTRTLTHTHTHTHTQTHTHAHVQIPTLQNTQFLAFFLAFTLFSLRAYSLALAGRKSMSRTPFRA